MRKNFLKFICVLAALGSLSVATHADAEDEGAPSLLSDWQFTVGAGVGYAPDYEGSDDYELGFLPDVEIVWRDRVSLSTGGLMVDAIKMDNWTFGVGARYLAGRKESDNEALRGLGKIKNSVEGVVYGGYSFEDFDIALDVAQDLGDGHEGATVALSADYHIAVAEDLLLDVGPDVTWASSDYMQSYFGISAKQAGTSVYSAYDAGAGFKDVGLHLQANYAITEHIAVTTMLQYTRLLGDAADSSIVQDKGSENQMFGGLMLSYSF